MEEKTRFRNTIIVVTAGILLYCMIQNYPALFRLFKEFIKLIYPFLMGGAIAFILNVPMRAIEKHLLPKVKRFDSFRRACSYLITLILLIGIISLALFVITPQVSATIKLVIERVPGFFQSFQGWLYDKTSSIPNVQAYINELDINWSSVSSHAINIIKTAGATVLSSGVGIVSGIIGGVTNFVIAFIFSIYLILQKEKLGSHVKQTLYAILSEKHADLLVYVGRLSNKIFSSFLSGQCIEAVILGTMFFVTLSIFRLPYAVLIGVVIAITALIPIFGAFIGCAVGAFLIVMVDPMQALWFLIIFIILQQLEGNLIYPYVVGGSIGLPSLWVLFAVTVGASLFGVAGILLFIPLCSVLYSLFRDFIKNRLKKKSVNQWKWAAISSDECAAIIDSFAGETGEQKNKKETSKQTEEKKNAPSKKEEKKK